MAIEWDNVRSKWKSLGVFSWSSLYLARLIVHVEPLRVGVLECIFIFTSTCRKAYNNQSLCQSVALLNQRTHWRSRPSSSKDVQINVSTSLGNKQRFDHNKRNRCLAKNRIFSIFQNKLMKVRESLHLPCSQQSFSLQQLAPPWQTNALVELEEEEEATSAVQQVAWVDFKDQNWWSSRLPQGVIMVGGNLSPLCPMLKPSPRSSKPGWDSTAWSRYSRSPEWERLGQPKMKFWVHLDT